VTRVSLLLLALAALIAPARAAHEWRGAWAAPYTLELAEAAVAEPPERVRLELAIARPFGLRELSSQHALLRFGGGAYEIHAGLLRDASYHEWHAGIARRFAPAAPAGVLLGARVFGIRVAHESRPVSVAHTALIRFAPGGSRRLEFEAGVVDAGLTREADAPLPLLVGRVRARIAGARAFLERSIAPGGPAETTIALGYPAGRLRLTHAIRLATGEVSVAVGWPAGPAEVSVAERWHPVLGWTPAVTARWRRKE
jgi:hypothetical protein